MIISSSALAANITTISGKLDCPLPAGFVTALAAGRALPRGAEELAANVAALHNAALDALAAGTDPADDPDVQRFAIHNALAGTGLRQAAEQRAGNEIRHAIAEYADDIVNGWAETTRDDCDVLATAAVELDLPDLAAADHTALRHRSQLNIWADAANSADRIDHVLRGYEAIITALGIDNSKTHRALLLAPDMDLAAFSAITGRDRSSAWAVARTGAPLRLATPAEYTAAIGRITAAQQELQRQAEAERINAQRAHRGALPTIGTTISELIGR